MTEPIEIGRAVEVAACPYPHPINCPYQDLHGLIGRVIRTDTNDRALVYCGSMARWVWRGHLEALSS